MAREAIFIGYRREDTADVAGRIYDALAGRFGKNRLFKDVDNLRPGADFGQYIQTLLPRCRVALILIGPNWIEARDETGARRLDDANDWVRIEIETALNAGHLDVVPVLVNGARMPRADELPRSLHPLLRRHAAIIRRDPDFHDDVARLATALRASVKSGVLDLASLGGERKQAAAGRGGADAPPIAAWLAGIAALALIVLLVWSPWSGPPANTADSSEQIAEQSAPSPQRGEGRQGGRTGEAANGAAALDPARPPPPTVDAMRRPPQAGGESFRDCAECPEMVAIPGGSFTMGSPVSEPGRDGDEGPQHSETVRAFAASKTEVTFAQWDACVAGGGCGGYRPEDQGWGRGNRPVINVSWNDAQAYVQWLSQRTGRRYRLLSEAEWEYAARAGTTAAYSTGSSISASQARFSSQSTAEVGSYPANPFGLHDMHGNVWEWVEDCYSANYDATRDCSFRVFRGGGWSNDALLLRSAYRYGVNPSFRSSVLGFRVARSASGG